MNKINIKKSSQKILLVEDDKSTTLLIKEILKKSEIEIHHVRDGTEAIVFINENPDTDLILMDIKLLTMDGYKATSEIRKINPSIPIIAETAYAMTGDREKAISAGCNDYIAKPFIGDDLIELVNKYLFN